MKLDGKSSELLNRLSIYTLESSKYKIGIVYRTGEKLVESIILIS